MLCKCYLVVKQNEKNQKSKIKNQKSKVKYDRKVDLIKHILNSENLSATETIMIGDRKYDILGARENQLTSIGVTYGYGTSAELIAAGATYLCNNPGEIFVCLQQVSIG